MCVCGGEIDPQKHVCIYKPSCRDQKKNLSVDLKISKCQDLHGIVVELD